MNMLLALSTIPVMFARMPEEDHIKTDDPAVHTYSFRKQNIFDYFNGVCTFMTITSVK